MGSKSSKEPTQEMPPPPQRAESIGYIFTTLGVPSDIDPDNIFGEDVPKLEMVKRGYAMLVDAIIRPPRTTYDLEDLGPVDFEFCTRHFHRSDFTFNDTRGYKIYASHWEPIESERPEATLPCVIFLHGNSSSRLGAIPQLSIVLSLGITLCGLDFSGSGLSEYEYVTLGYYEQDDVNCLIKYLREKRRVDQIVLWGRSMGASTCLLCAAVDPSISAIIPDSAFGDLKELCLEICTKLKDHGINLWPILYKTALKVVSRSVYKKTQFDITNYRPIDSAEKCKCPCLLIIGNDDDFVPPHHSFDIKKRYNNKTGVNCELLEVEGDHNSMRPQEAIEMITIFLLESLHLDGHLSLPIKSDLVRSQLPWGGEAEAFMYRQGDLFNNDVRASDISYGDLNLEGEWSCPMCTLINMPNTLQCEACQSLRPDIASGF